ncbi:hypothetical protein H2200_001794 [Cladophialophora chaetospira]|uniref:Peptidase A1 domain-containing protein n=1 Tax=Cladophialophora chaetospira TaxID=386627 RepID=A0AA38XLJ6_9EURO|nr:hypothetical protein H2200_001794 [Cladophialophora chaetospira]
MPKNDCPHLPKPLQLPITYHQVSADAVAWGVDIRLGSPVQRFSLFPSLHDFTFVANSLDCGSPDPSSLCLASVGGTYDKNLSLTGFETASTPWKNRWNGSIDFGDASQYALQNDVLAFGSDDKAITGYPFATDTATQIATAYGTWLGLGANSTFLKALVAGGVAPSMSWGLSAGSRQSEPPTDGLLVIGGYDDTRVGGDFSTFDSRHDCPTCIRLQELTWVPETGTPVPLWHKSLLNLDISIDPLWESLLLPSPVFQAFGNSTGGKYNETYQLFTYAASAVPKGNMKFTIKNGHSSSIPASTLFGFPHQYEENGTVGIYDDSFKLAQVQQFKSFDPSISAQAIFGIPFLLSNYLIMDIERSQFRLSEAVRDDQHATGGSVVKTLCPQTFDSSTPHRNNIGAVVGSVVGGLGGVLFIVSVLFLWYFRSKGGAHRATRRDEPHARQLYRPVAVAHDSRVRLVLDLKPAKS